VPGRGKNKKMASKKGMMKSQTVDLMPATGSRCPGVFFLIQTRGSASESPTPFFFFFGKRQNLPFEETEVLRNVVTAWKKKRKKEGWRECGNGKWVGDEGTSGYGGS
jgi:hypothetical protein